MKRLATFLVAGLLLAGMAPASFTAISTSHAQGTTGPSPATVTVLIGLNQSTGSHGAILAFTPKYIDITVGDTVVFKNMDKLEPHTVSFGPMKLLRDLSNNFASPVGPKNGPPTAFVINSQFVSPTKGNTYNGTGFASSGVLFGPGKTWKLTFTKAGTYKYGCLVHSPDTMNGTIIVHDPMTLHQGTTWFVQAGDGQAAFNDRTNNSAADDFYPKHITIHVGDTVEWIGGFHTVTYGPEAMLSQLEKNLIVPVPNTSGPPRVEFNPKITTPAGGPTFDGTGFVNSGILFFTVPPNSKAPPMFKLKFTKAGTFTFDCMIHPNMDMKVTVGM